MPRHQLADIEARLIGGNRIERPAHLGRRLPGYDYGKHFGGAAYLFVRGVRPDWRDGEGNPLGVWFHRPKPEALASLDRLIGGREALAA